jgi:hypothetical protein
MQLMGIGTALKILLLPEADLKATSLKREEVVALFNTLFKLSHAIDSLDFLTELSLQPRETASVSQPKTSTSLLADDVSGDFLV